MTSSPYNFARPVKLASYLDQPLGRWLQGGLILATKACARKLACPVELAYRGAESGKANNFLAALPEGVLVHRLALEGDRAVSLLAMPRPTVLALIGAMLGDAQPTLPADRELTAIEESLYEFFLQTLCFPWLQETWQGSRPIRLELRQTEKNPRWSRLFGLEEPLVVCKLAVQGPFGAQEGWWLLPLKGLCDLLNLAGPAIAPLPAGEPVTRQRLESLVQDMPVEVTVLLGQVNLPLSQLSRLNVGDVILLDQQVDETLIAHVGGVKRFQGWPGCLGSKQAFRIESVVEE